MTLALDTSGALGYKELDRLEGANMASVYASFEFLNLCLAGRPATPAKLLSAAYAWKTLCKTCGHLPTTTERATAAIAFGLTHFFVP